MPLCPPETVAFVVSEASLVANVRQGRTGETSVAEADVASHWVARRKALPFPNHLIEIT